MHRHDSSQCVNLQPRRSTSVTGKPPHERLKPVQIDHSTVISLQHLPAPDAAKQLGISLTALKHACRKLAIERWPYQKPPKRQKTRLAAKREHRSAGTSCDLPSSGRAGTCYDLPSNVLSCTSSHCAKVGLSKTAAGPGPNLAAMDFAAMQQLNTHQQNLLLRVHPSPVHDFRQFKSDILSTPSGYHHYHLNRVSSVTQRSTSSPVYTSPVRDLRSFSSESSSDMSTMLPGHNFEHVRNLSVPAETTTADPEQCIVPCLENDVEQHITTNPSKRQAEHYKNGRMHAGGDTPKTTFQGLHACRDVYEEPNQMEHAPRLCNLGSSSALYNESSSRDVTADHANVHVEGAQRVARMQVDHTCPDAHLSAHIAMGQHLPVQQVIKSAMVLSSTRFMPWSCGGASSSSDAIYQPRQSVLPNTNDIQTKMNVPNPQSISSHDMTNMGPAPLPTSIIDGEKLWACHTHWLQPGEQWLRDPKFDSVLASLP